MKRLIKYFAELLATLRSIDAHLAAIDANTSRLASTVSSQQSSYGGGGKAAIRTTDTYRS